MRRYSERSEAQAKEIEGKSAEDHLGETILSSRDRHMGRKSSAWLASPTPQTASRHCWFGCRCGARGGRKVSSLAWDIPSNPSQLPSATCHFWKHHRFGFFSEHLSAIFPGSDSAELEIRQHHSLEPEVQLQAVAGSMVCPGIRESSSSLPCFLAMPFQDAVTQRKHNLLV